jgi:hypothetical protein
MVSPSHGNHFSRGPVLRRNFPTRRGFGMIASRKSLKPENREMEMRTCPLSDRQRRERERVPRVIVRGKPHSRVRRRT